MHFVGVQRVDWDDFPKGHLTKIGPFDSQAEAEEFLEEAPGFFKDDYHCWRMLGMGRYTVTIKSFLEEFVSPKNFLDKQNRL